MRLFYSEGCSHIYYCGHSRHNLTSPTFPDLATSPAAYRLRRTHPRRRPTETKIVCEYPDRARTKGNPRQGPVSWMTEHPPDVDKNTTYETSAERQAYAVTSLPTAPATGGGGGGGGGRGGRGGVGGGATAASSSSSTANRTAVARRARSAAPKSAPTQLGPRGSGTAEEGLDPPPCSFLGPAKQAIAVPVLSVRLKLRAIEEEKLEAERIAAAIVAEAEAAKAKTSQKFASLSYLRPLKKTPRATTTTASHPPEQRKTIVAKRGSRSNNSSSSSPVRTRASATSGGRDARRGGSQRRQSPARIKSRRKTTRSSRGRSRNGGGQSPQSNRVRQGMSEAKKRGTSAVDGSRRGRWGREGKSEKFLADGRDSGGSGGRYSRRRKSRSRSSIRRVVPTTTPRRGNADGPDMSGGGGGARRLGSGNAHSSRTPSPSKWSASTSSPA